MQRPSFDRALLALVALSAAAIAFGCSGDSGVPTGDGRTTSDTTTASGQAVTATGNLDITTTTTGQPLDPDGYRVSVDGGAGRAIGKNQTITVSNLSAGPHSVRLSGIAPNCAAVGKNPKTVDVPSGGTAQLHFFIKCVVDLSGSWVFSEVYSDQALGLSCQDNGVLTITQAGGTFTGNYVQTGACDTPTGAVDQTGAVSITGGSISGTTITFVQQGFIPCNYTGSITGIPASALGGSFTCTGTYNGVQYNFSGTWQASPAGPNPTGVIDVTLSTSGTGIVSSFTAKVSNAQGTVAIFTASGATNKTSPALIPGAYTVSVTPSDNCQVTGSNQVAAAVTGGGAAQASFTVRCGVSSLHNKIVFETLRSGDNVFVMNPDGSKPVRFTDTYPATGDPTVAPDGKAIAFSRLVSGGVQIFSQGLHATKAKRLTHGPRYDFLAAWSPDGAKIAFVSDRDGNYEIYVMNADGTNPVRLTNDAGSDMYPAWSPNGAKIVFSSGRSGGGIFTMNPDGSSVTRLTTDPNDLRPVWSPDGTKIAFDSERLQAGNRDIYVVKANGRGLVRLTTDAATDFGAAWSPDGSKIVWTNGSYYGNDDEIYVMDANGANAVRLTNNTVFDGEATWSP